MAEVATCRMRPIAIIAGIFARWVNAGGCLTLEPFFAPPAAWSPPIFGDDLRAALIRHNEGAMP